METRNKKDFQQQTNKSGLDDSTASGSQQELSEDESKDGVNREENELSEDEAENIERKEKEENTTWGSSGSEEKDITG